jgi:UPF0271 protein
MVTKKKKYIYILDTSAILAGIPIDINNASLATVSDISNELKTGGRDYRWFQFLIERGLSIQSPTKKSIKKVNSISGKTGDFSRLSTTDIKILALALDINENDEKVAIILSDDYSIQNVAHVLKIKFETIIQSGITKRFKWSYRCRGCGKKFKDNVKICPICGFEIRTVISSKRDIKR